MLYPDLHVLTNEEHWKITPEAHKYAAAAKSSCFVISENGEQQDIFNLTSIPGVQRSLCLEEVTDDSSSTRIELPNGVDNQTTNMLERCMATCGKAEGTRAKRKSRARKEASAQEVRGYYKQFGEAKHLEWKSWIANEVFDFVDMRNTKPKNYVTGRWVLTTKTDKHGNFLRAKARRVLQDKQKDYLQTVHPASTRQGFRMSRQMAASRSWDLFHIGFKTAFLQGQSYDVNLMLCINCHQPPKIAARLKKPAYGMNDAPRRWWNILDTALRSYGMFHTRADRRCYVLYSIQSRKQAWEHWIQGAIAQQNGTKETFTESREQSEMEAPFEKKNTGSYSWKLSCREIRGKNHRSVRG